MKKMNENQLRNLEAGRMFGSTTYGCTNEYSGNGCYTKYCNVKTQFLWIVTERLTHIPQGTTCG